MKRKRSVLFLLITLLVFVMLTGCGEKMLENKGTNETTEPTETLATKEYLMEYYDLTEEDLEGLDIEKQIEYYGMSNAVITESTREDILGYLMDSKIRMETEIEDAKYDLSYLVEAPENKGKNHPVDKVKYITYFANIAEGGFSYLYDFENGIIYYSVGGGGVYKNYRDAMETFVLTDELREDVMQALKEAKVNKWKYFYQEYENGEPVYDSEFYWEFGLEYEDGVVISRSGWGEVPETFGIITSVLESVVPPIEY